MESNNSELVNDLVNGSQQLSEDLKCEENSLENKLMESESKLHKFKALAVKLKKELNETKDQLSKSLSETQELKVQLSKSQDKDKISASYQQVVRNFQSLQSEYDKLQDESDSLKSRNKELEHDLANSVNELTKVREQLADTKQELESVKNTLSLVNEEKDSLESKKKELESKIIILQSDLDSERKRNVANTGLEQTINELHYQLDLKTTEIVDLTDQLEGAKDNVERYEELLKEKQQLISQVQYLEKENFNFKEDIKKYSQTVETQLSELEQNKIRCSESTSLIQSLESRLKSTNELNHKTVKSLESKVSELQTQLDFLEVEIKKKDEKFEEYKVRVCKVLKQQQNGSQNHLENSKQIENLETTIKNLNIDTKSLREKLEMNIQEKQSLESSLRQLNISHNSLKNELNECNALKERITEYKNENEKLKSLARDLQLSMVNDRKEAENYHMEKIEEMERTHKSVIVSLEEELREANSELSGLRLEVAKLSNQSNKIEVLNKSHQSINTLDELESVETTSIPNKTVSASPNSLGGNFLEEIMYSSDTQHSKPPNEFTMHLTVAQNKVQNLTQLLEESESNNMLISEQNRVLKDEIRRLQRSVERIEMAENLEYLKNIIVKFITLNGDDERQQLIPVLATILKLSPEEQNLFQNFTSCDQNPTNNKWRDYLYQWSGTNK